MPPTLSKHEQSLEETIIEVYRTLQRNESRTLELRRRSARVVEESSAQLTQRRSGTKDACLERLSESLQYTPGSLRHNASKHNVNMYATFDPRRHKIVQSEFPCPKNNQTSTSSTLPSDEKSDKRNERRKSTHSVRNIVFETLDKILLLSRNTSSNSINANKHSRQKTTVGLDTLRKLTANDTDTLPRENSTKETLSIERNLQPCNSEISENRKAYDIDDNSKTLSDDGDSWVYVSTPLQINEVGYTDSLESRSPENSMSSADKVKNLSLVEIPSGLPRNACKSKPHYVRRYQKGKENKIRTKGSKLHCKSNNDELTGSSISTYLQDDKEKTKRPDSPFKAKKNLPLKSAPSLPKFDETASVTENFLPDCGTNSFKREISLRPSSTLSRSVPCLSSFTFEDDGCTSSASSFTSLKIPDEEIPFVNYESHPHLRAIPSALCKNVYVTPINVPVIPFQQKQNVFRCVSAESLPKHSENYDPKNDNQVAYFNSNLRVKVTDGISIENLKRLVESEPESEDEMAIVRKEFAWLDEIENDQFSVTSSGMEEPSTTSVSSGLKSENDTCSLITLNSSIPPPPPSFPPPPPPPPPMMTSTIRGLLPLTVFTQPQSENTIFSNIENIHLKDDDAKMLREKFPPKKANSKIPRLQGKRENKSKMNFEMFLKTWKIEDFEPIIELISTLDAEHETVDTACISALTQLLVNEKFEYSQLENKKRDPVESFIFSINKIPRLREKLQCLQFSLDFEDSVNKSRSRIEAFIAACMIVTESKKFISLIGIVVSFLNHMNPDDKSKIYGFEIQSLSKLATNRSQDGSTTLLHFLIEYIMNEPTLSDSVDFYLDFKDLSDVAKTSIKDLVEESKAWKRNLQNYKIEIENIMKSHETGGEVCKKFQFANKFCKSAEKILQDIQGKLVLAKQNFDSCKERYALSTSQITEMEFFASLSNFIAAYRKTHHEILERNIDRERRKSYSGSFRVPPTPQENPSHQKPRRNACDSKFITPKLTGIDSPELDGELGESLLKMLENKNDIRKGRVRPKGRFSNGI